MFSGKGGVSRPEAVMPVKGLQLFAFVVATLVSSAAFAEEPPRRMIGGDVDLKDAVLSPAPFGPPSQFAPPPSAAKPEAAPATAAKPEDAPTTPKPEAAPTTAAKPETAPAVAKSKPAAPRRSASSKPRQKPAVAKRKPKADPLDSYARDTRRQVWPCTGGGICNWTQPR
jgi:hypothetical protein